MNTAAKDMDFLQAAKLRDEMFALENILKDKN
jgi:excinuclease ABC subunit B